jgi:hypothetical protein
MFGVFSLYPKRVSAWRSLAATHLQFHPSRRARAPPLNCFLSGSLLGFLEQMHSSSWVAGLYASSVIGTAIAAAAIYGVSSTLGFSLPVIPLYGCFGGIFGLLVAFGVLYGDMEFLLFFPSASRLATWPSSMASSPLPCCSAQQGMYAFRAAGRRAGRAAVHPPRSAAGNLLCFQRAVVRPAQPLLPLEAPPRRTQV